MLESSLWITYRSQKFMERCPNNANIPTNTTMSINKDFNVLWRGIVINYLHQLIYTQKKLLLFIIILHLCWSFNHFCYKIILIKPLSNNRFGNLHFVTEIIVKIDKINYYDNQRKDKSMDFYYSKTRMIFIFKDSPCSYFFVSLFVLSQSVTFGEAMKLLHWNRLTLT